MRILLVTSEAYPLIKTGGLADVSGSLPKALQSLGVDVRILIPAYLNLIEQLRDCRKIATIDHLPHPDHAHLLLGKMPDSDVEVIAIQCKSLYERTGGPYTNSQGQDWADNALRFGVLSKIASILSSEDSPLKDWIPDIVHCNDWQTGLTPTYLHFMPGKKAKTVLSIHNLAFQGCYPENWVEQLQLPKESYNINGAEYYGQLSFLKAGIYFADGLSTVSPTYAKEIQTDGYGFGMQGLLTTRGDEIRGILNGIDDHEWSPAKDAFIPANYNQSRMAGKYKVKQALQKKLALEVRDDVPLIGVVSRLTHQKGLDIFAEICQVLIAEGVQIAILGSGEKALEQKFIALNASYPQQVAVTIGYNEPLSHHMMAGCDMFMMPSRFEPCGLNQMYGLAYGTPPIVSSTGGLADSVCNTTEETLHNNTATGFLIAELNATSLLTTTQRAIALWHDKSTWKKIQKNGMSKDLSWHSSAKSYLEMFEHLLRI